MFRAVGMGFAGLLTGSLAARVLGHWETPLNFRICFAIGTSLFLVSCVTMWTVRDHVDPSTLHRAGEARASFGRYLRDIVHYMWLNPNYRVFLFFQVLIAISLVGSPFMVAAARDKLGATAANQGVFSVVYLGGSGVSGMGPRLAGRQIRV